MARARKTGGKRAHAPPHEPLTPERIALAALALIEDDGLDGFSTRKLGERLGCEAMSIYHHFPSKAHLLNALVDRLIAAIALPPKHAEPVERIRQVAHAFRRIGHQHPRLFPYVALHRLNSATCLGFLDAVIGMFHDAGLDAESAARLFRAFAYYLIGAVLDETSGYAKGPSAVEPVSDEEVAQRFLNVAAAGPYFRSDMMARTFDVGLEIFLDAVRDAARATGGRRTGGS